MSRNYTNRILNILHIDFCTLSVLQILNTIHGAFFIPFNTRSKMTNIILKWLYNIDYIKMYTFSKLKRVGIKTLQIIIYIL